jgi:DnaJ-class molecular chaperone
MSQSPFYDANVPIKSRGYSNPDNYDKIFRKGEETIEAMNEEKVTHTRPCTVVTPTGKPTGDVVCPHCKGKGYRVVREIGIDQWGHDKRESHQMLCNACAGEGKLFKD